jgi:hypothetical protein
MLNMIEEGMQVLDKQGRKVGTVEFIHFSEANDGSHRTAAASTPDDLPEELCERLFMHGFIRIDSAKLFGADCYVMLDQIAMVDRTGVQLNVADSQELLEG